MEMSIPPTLLMGFGTHYLYVVCLAHHVHLTSAAVITLIQSDWCLDFATSVTRWRRL